MRDALRCTRCSDVLGVYEPVVVVDHRGWHYTSLAAEPFPARSGEARYHAACYEAIHAAPLRDERDGGPRELGT
jgi:hypothetical protein